MNARQEIDMLWLTVRRCFVLNLLFVLGSALVQSTSAQQPIRPNAALGVAVRAPSMPSAKADTAIVRGRYSSESLRMIQAVAEKFPARDKLDVAFDDHASFGRFCDHDAPFHVVICEGNLTSHHNRCWEQRFIVETPQPETFAIGQFRVVFVVSKSNPIQSLDFVGIRRAHSQPCKGVTWREVNGAGVAAIHCYGLSERTWVRQLIQEKCMTRWRDLEATGGRELQRLGFRDDLVVCADAKEVIAKVRKDRYGLGFFAIGQELSERDLQGVKVLPIKVKEGDEAIAPTLEAVVDGSYPLSEPVFLYLHPDAPKEAREFCKFATGPEAAKIVKQCGLWPEYDLEQICGKQRLAELRRGKGTTIRVCDLTSSARLLNDLAAKYVKAKAAVRLNLQGQGAGDEGEVNKAVEKFSKDGSELLLIESGSGRRMATPAAKIQPPKSILLGRMAVGIIVHPKNILNSLPLDELRGIYCREVTQWPAANGVAGAMHVYGLQHSDPITQLLKKKLSGQLEKELKYKAESDTAKIVSDVAKDPYAIGFVDLSQLSPNEISVKLLDIYLPGQSKQPRASTTVEGGKSEKTTSPTPHLSSLAVYRLPENYPLMRTLTLYISPQASETAKDFAQFVTSDRCGETLVKHRLLPSGYIGSRNPEPETAMPKKPQKPYLGNRR